MIRSILVYKVYRIKKRPDLVMEYSIAKSGRFDIHYLVSLRVSDEQAADKVIEGRNRPLLHQYRND